MAALDNTKLVLSEHSISSQEVQNDSGEQSHGELQPEHEVRKTPFPHPSSGSLVPPMPVLTTEQTTAYNSLVNIVSMWTTIPVTNSPNAEQSPLSEAEQMWLTKECLLRYLRASKWSVATAQTRLLTTLQWRRSYGITATPESQTKLTASYVSVENETGKQWLLGYDKAGRPCHYLNPSRQNTKRSNRQIEHLVFMLERAIELMPPGQETLALLINFAETSSGQGASFSQGKQTLSILQNHYPERLGRALLCNLPWHFWTFMKLITPFIDPITRSKLVFDQPLQSHVPSEQLLVSHGGKLLFEYDHATYWPSLDALATRRRDDMTERWVKGGRRVGESELYLRGGTDRCTRDVMEEMERKGKLTTVENADSNRHDERIKKTVSIVDGKGEEEARQQAGCANGRNTGANEDEAKISDTHQALHDGKTGNESEIPMDSDSGEPVKAE